MYGKIHHICVKNLNRKLIIMRIKPIYLTLCLAISLLSACRSSNPEFTFHNYEQEFATKQPYSIKYSFIHITNAYPNSTLEKIENFNRKVFFELEGDVPKSLEECIKLSCDKFCQEYRCNEKRIGESTYELTKSSSIEVYDQTLAYTIEAYQYTGGAHGMTWLHGLNYSLENGELLGLDDFFTKEQQEKLPKALVLLLCWQKGLDGIDEAELEKMGYDPKAIVATDNFRVTSTGIEFLYNPYEIGAYSLGKTIIKLPYAMIDQLLEL